ncbi:hypothetical protein CPT_Seuss120 [Caulobacter phage Seuss]|uniref:Uncharacterized protein n=1 Tax=Caulobacter phage Seuss TaxID=1675601 RepID=A0A0K1LMA8_9CAUD|nr:hypothetical protein HOR08_gp003 [Caulobacter phage Seuss]YP_009785630.1 hypothetical protein HOR08_gp120 [Caulobacter phage Seuss]AKU43529.1 hypothetical protein CPT_Seuss3 [Caulobacter phage Seuss]AKU43646.1 hypothetical protein CPT_Seuss120 [Caulobacter phage Seuss]
MENALKIFENYTGRAISAVATQVTGLERAQGGVQKAMTVAFAAILAADHGQSPASASKLLADKVPGVTAGTANVIRTRCRKAFEEPGMIAKLRAAIGEPGAVDPDAFDVAIATFCGGFCVRKMEEARAAQKRLEAASVKAATAANPSPSTILEPQPKAEPEPAEPRNEVFDLQVEATRQIRNLITVSQWEDQGKADAARLALAAIYAEIGEALAPAQEVAKAA